MTNPAGPTHGTGDMSPRGCDLNEISLSDALGFELRFAPDDLAPPVDHDLLRDVVRRELPQEATKEAYRLIALFRSWYEAWREAVLADADPRR